MKNLLLPTDLLLKVSVVCAGQINVGSYGIKMFFYYGYKSLAAYMKNMKK